MTNAVIYARYSSHAQREESIEGQLRKCHEFARDHNFCIVEEYCDRATSGKTDNRTEFQRMIRDSEKGKFSAVIMYTLDRFARNRYDSAMYKAKLKKNGVRLYYTEQAITAEPEGIILEAVLEGMAEYYSENLARGVRRGMNENALKAQSNGGTVPLGYKIENKRYVTDPLTAPIVEEIFASYVGGMSMQTIANSLNEKGYRTRSGTPFRVGSLTSVLKNPKYTGKYIFNGTVVPDGMPRIVSDEIFEAAQKMTAKNKRRTGKITAPEEYLLTGKLFCGHCGSAMRGESGTGEQGVIYNYYKCADRKKAHSCDKANEKKERIERAVIDATLAMLRTPGAIEDIAEKAAKIAQDEYNDKSTLLALKQEQKQIQLSITNLLKLVEKGIETDDIGDRLLDLNAQKGDLLKRIAVEESKKPLITKERVAYWLHSFADQPNTEDLEYRRTLVDTLVNKVFIYDNPDGSKKLVLFYNTTNNNTATITLSDSSEALKSSECSSHGSPRKGVHAKRVPLFVSPHLTNLNSANFALQNLQARG